MAIRYTTKPNACGECGMTLPEMGTFHPHVFCLMFQAGIRDPWAEFAWCVERVTGQQLPKNAPLVRNLPALREEAESAAP